MYQKNIKTYYNRHYGRANKADLDSPSKMLHKRMLEQDSDDEEFVSSKLLDQEQKLREQKLGRIMFLVTGVILLVNLIKSASTYLSSTNTRQWWWEVQIPQFNMTWGTEGSPRLLSPALWGLTVAAGTWILIYFDSKTPGTNPKLPEKKEMVNPANWPMAYWTSILCGVFVFLAVLLVQL